MHSIHTVSATKECWTFLKYLQWFQDLFEIGMIGLVKGIGNLKIIQKVNKTKLLGTECSLKNVYYWETICKEPERSWKTQENSTSHLFTIDLKKTRLNSIHSPPKIECWTLSRSTVRKNRLYFTTLIWLLTSSTLRLDWIT